MLQLLNLIQVVDERLGDLLDKERSIRNLELDLLLDLFVVVRGLGHALLSRDLRHLTCTLQSDGVTHESR